MIGVILTTIVALGYETWALIYRRHHNVKSAWLATISEGVWKFIATNNIARLAIVFGCALLGAHLAFKVP